MDGWMDEQTHRPLHTRSTDLAHSVSVQDFWPEFEIFAIFFYSVTDRWTDRKTDAWTSTHIDL